MIFFKIFFFVCLGIYIISMIEVIGSHYLSIKSRGYCSNAKLVFTFLIPPFAPFFAISNYSCADDVYSTKGYNTYKIDESFYGYILHGFRTMNQWHFYKERKNR